jgi:hypothetical protein
MVMNPVSAVDGDRAQGTWSFVGPFPCGKNTAQWQAVRSADAYVQGNGEGQYPQLRAHRRMSADDEIGWAQQQGLRSECSKKLLLIRSHDSSWSA